MSSSDRVSQGSIDCQTANPRLSTIIVTWYSSNCIEECLDSLERESSDSEVIVVDNESRDGTQRIVRKKFRWVRLIENRRNLGYARANNQGIERSSGEYILFLNPDTVLNDQAIGRMMDFIQNRKEIGALAPQLLNSDLSVQPSCREFPTLKILIWDFLGFSHLFPRSKTFGCWRMGYFDHKSMREVDQPMGSCLLVPRRVLNDAGVFDEGFPMFMNDVDLCFRIRKAGWSILFFPEASVIHRLGESTHRVKPEMIISSHRSIYHYFKKHHPSPVNELLGAFLLLAAFIRMALLRLKT